MIIIKLSYLRHLFTERTFLITIPIFMSRKFEHNVFVSFFLSFRIRLYLYLSKFQYLDIICEPYSTL